jgi:hypothetical protein
VARNTALFREYEPHISNDEELKNWKESVKSNTFLIDLGEDHYNTSPKDAGYMAF